MNLPFFNFVKGANTNLSPMLQPPNTLSVQQGCVTSWKLGSIIKDLGYARVSTATAGSKQINGLFDFQQNPATQKVIKTHNDTTDANTELWYKTPSGAWTNIVTAAWNTYPNQKVEMASFIGYCFFVGYNSTTDTFLPVASLTGTTFSTATNVTDMPQGKFIRSFLSRLYVANVKYGGTAYPYRVTFSDIVSAGALTWQAAHTTDFIDFDYGLEITGISDNWNRLVVFTKYSAWMYDGSSRWKAWDTGCSNHRTICNNNQFMIWANDDGVWISEGGGYPQNIAGEMIDFIRNANPDNFFAALVDEEYHLYVGTVTVQGVTYTNQEIVFNFPTNGWRGREFANAMSIFARYDSPTTNRRLYMGDTSGNVWDKSKYTDATIANGDGQTTLGTGGTDISAKFSFVVPLNTYSLGQNVDNIWAYAERAQGINLKYRIIDRNSRVLTTFMPLGQLNKFVSAFGIVAKSGSLIEIEGVEKSAFPYFSFLGLELEVSENETLTKT